MDVRGGGANGTIDIAGEKLAAITLGSVVNGVEVTSTNAASYWSNPEIAGSLTLTAGDGAVASIVCGGDTPRTPEIPVSNPGQPVVPPVVETPGIDPFTFELGGLPFQNLRPDLVGKANRKLVLRLGKRNLFTTKAYTPITQEILTLADKEYSTQVAQEVSRSQALAATVNYLKDAGVDADIATTLLAAITSKSYTATTPVIDALTLLAKP
jgi:hypothetical protein